MQQYVKTNIMDELEVAQKSIYSISRTWFFLNSFQYIWLSLSQPKLLPCIEDWFQIANVNQTTAKLHTPLELEKIAKKSNILPRLIDINRSFNKGKEYRALNYVTTRPTKILLIKVVLLLHDHSDWTTLILRDHIDWTTSFYAIKDLFAYKYTCVGPYWIAQ